MTSPGPASRTKVRFPSPTGQYTFAYPFKTQASMPSVLPSQSANVPFSKTTAMWCSISLSTKSCDRFKQLSFAPEHREGFFMLTTRIGFHLCPLPFELMKERFLPGLINKCSTRLFTNSSSPVLLLIT